MGKRWRRPPPVGGQGEGRLREGTRAVGRPRHSGVCCPVESSVKSLQMALGCAGAPCKGKALLFPAGCRFLSGRCPGTSGAGWAVGMLVGSGLGPESGAASASWAPSVASLDFFFCPARLHPDLKLVLATWTFHRLEAGLRGHFLRGEKR